ncbi:MAG: hypothetical protein JSW07_12145 [bacterium]|nr:MAG: hypothetical protein JSW07_12145 [bacterium]
MTEETSKTKWEKTKQELNFYEQKLIDCYLQFLRDTAEFFIKRVKEVFFRQNTVVHWSEGGFGTLYIIETDEDKALLPGYISEIWVVSSVENIRFSGKEITLDNLRDITYRMDQWH